MEPDAVQRQKEPLECRVIFLGALTLCRNCRSGNLAERLTKFLSAIDDPFLLPCLLGRIHIKLFSVRDRQEISWALWGPSVPGIG